MPRSASAMQKQTFVLSKTPYGDRTRSPPVVANMSPEILCAVKSYLRLQTSAKINKDVK